jgi:murein DD-endopeptidase MepM/ murein hydrolase activator NlpD
MTSTHYYESGHTDRTAASRPHTAGAVSHQRNHHHPRGDGRSYTLTHAGHQVRIGPVAFWIVVGTLVIMGIWSIATGTYFAFRDDVLTRLIARHAQMQFAYEDRIADLRAQIDRVISHQLIDQEQFEKKLEALLRRQATLESRTATLTGDAVPGGGAIRGSRQIPSPGASGPLKPSPISDTVILVVPPDREARLQSRGLPDATIRLTAMTNSGGLDDMLGKMVLSLDRVEQSQSNALTAMEETIDIKARRIRGVLADIGVNLRKQHGDITGSIGGPFIPVNIPDKSGSAGFERQLQRIKIARSKLEQYHRALVAVPVRKPVVGEVDMSSPFGMRMDPFLRGPAIHSGIDLRGNIGAPVRATASGKIVTASWQGGYGKMIEIDHGNGLKTRYGHLSAIEVKIGQHVSNGQTIGRIGSTGRSTGPHLHYETRVNDEAVDPQKFLRAGVRLGGL